MTRRKTHAHRAKLADIAAKVGEEAAAQTRRDLPADADITPEQAAFLVELNRFNATRSLPRSTAQKLMRRQQAKRMEQRASELFPGIPAEIV